MTAPESLITQVAPPGIDKESSLAGIITQVKPSIAGGGSLPPVIPMDRSSSLPSQQKNAGNSVEPSKRTSSFRFKKPSQWKSSFNSIFSCCRCGLRDMEAELDEKDHDPSVAPVAKAIIKTAPTPSPKPKPSPTLSNSKVYLLPPLEDEDNGKKCLVLDLDETLVHSSFKPVPQADFIIPVEIDDQVHNVYVLKRPGVDVFLQRLGPQFEIVVFTASLAKYADPVLDKLDKYGVVDHRLFREACIHHKGNYVKDLGQLGRDLRDVIILDNSPASYIFHPSNAIPITSWFSDPNDTELLDLIPFLEDLKLVDDVTKILDNSKSD